MGVCSSVEASFCEILPAALRRPVQVKLAATVIFSIPTGSMLRGAEPTDAYHTSVILDDRCEYVFNSMGVLRLPPLHSHMVGTQKTQVIEMGHSTVAASEMLHNVCPHFKPGTYDLIKKNCNSFTDCALFFLLGTRLDARYRQLERFCKWGQDSFRLVDALRLVGLRYKENPEAADFKAGIIIERLAKVRGIESVRHVSSPDPGMARARRESADKMMSARSQERTSSKESKPRPRLASRTSNSSAWRAASFDSSATDDSHH